MRLVAVLAIAVLAGCSSMQKVDKPGFTEEVLAKDGTRTSRTMTKEAQFNETVKQIASVPLFELTCPATGCIMTSLKVAQPLGGQLQGLLVQPKEAPPELHPAAQVAREFFQPLKELGLALGPAWIVGGVAKAGYASLERFGSVAVQSVQAPAGTSVAISGSNGVGVLGGNGSSTNLTSTSTDSHNQSSVVNDSSQDWALSLLCNFTMTTGSPPAYCSQR